MTAATTSLRPRSLADFEGQPDVSTQLNIIIGAAKARGEVVVPHLLFAGPPGLGKTTLANILATELSLPLLTATGPGIEKTGDLAALLVSLPGPSVVFIDEVHRIPVDVQEMLYSAMEDGRIDILAGDGATNAQVYSMDLEPFVLVAATTEAGRLARPFLDRFGYVGRLEPYDLETLTRIVQRSARTLGTEITAEAAAIIAGRGRGTPRIANQLLGRVRDTAAVTDADVLDAEVTQAALTIFGIDGAGLGKVDRQILQTIVSQFNGGPVGLRTLAAAVNEDPGTVEASHEPHLMRSGLLQRTLRGRCATAKTYEYLQLPVPEGLLDAQ